MIKIQYCFKYLKISYNVVLESGYSQLLEASHEKLNFSDNKKKSDPSQNVEICTKETNHQKTEE